MVDHIESVNGFCLTNMGKHSKEPVGSDISPLAKISLHAIEEACKLRPLGLPNRINDSNLDFKDDYKMIWIFK